MNIKSPLRLDLLFLDTTDRGPVRTALVVHIRVAKVKVEAVSVVVVRSGGPVDAVEASVVGNAFAVVAEAGSREKDLRYTCCI